MVQDTDGERAAAPAPAPSQIDGMLYNGVDQAAARRAHSRELTTARQAAERRYTQPTAEGAHGASGLRAELVRIEAVHRAWLLEHGAEVVERPMRRRRSSARVL